MIKSITFKSRKNKKSRFESVLILTGQGLSMVDTSHPCAKTIEEFIEFVTGRQSSKNSEVEIVLGPPMRNKNNGKPDFLVVPAPGLLSSIGQLKLKFESLTGQEKKVLKYILRYFKQMEICKMLHISLNTEKTHRRVVHEKMQLKSFSELTDSERELLLRFTH